MSKAVSGINTGIVPPATTSTAGTTSTTSTTATAQPKNYGQLRSQIAHSMNALRSAMRTGDDTAIKSAALSLAKLLNVNLGDTSKMSGSDALKALETKSGVTQDTIKNSDPTQAGATVTTVQMQTLIAKL